MSVIIRLQNLPLSAAASDVRTFFSGLKIPDGAVHIVGGPEGDVFVGFASDEDARQAMRRDRLKIHDAEVRLLLSSKTEMSTVIEQAKNGFFPSADPDPEIPTQPVWQAPPPVHEKPTNPYAARPGYTPSYPPKVGEFPPTYQRNNVVQEQQPHVEAARLPPPTEPYYKASTQSYQNDNSHAKYTQQPNIRQVYQPPPTREVSQQVQKSRPIEEHVFGGLPPHLRPPFGIPPPQLRPAFVTNESPKLPKMEAKIEQLPIPDQISGSDSWRGGNSAVPFKQEESSKRRPLLGNGASVNLINGANQPRMYPPPLMSQKPIIPIQSQNFYIELTRMPNELLRPASLESFIRPSVPLSLSSAKTVFGPGGVHVNTLVRLDTHEDYMAMLKRDGEMGIRIRRSTKKDFDDANEGVPGAPVMPIIPVVQEDQRRRRSPPKRRSRSPPRRRRSPDREREKGEIDENRRRDRSRSPRRSPPRRRRDRSPARIRRRSTSRDRRVAHSDPTRWCLQVTNVPFRIKEEDLIEWFSEKVKPAKLHRTFYADGNASDRWIAEFSSESLMDRAFAIRSLCQGRTLRLAYIANNKVDEILKIEDVYGNEKKAKNEEKRIMDIVENTNPPSFFNPPPMKTVIPGTPAALPAPMTVSPTTSSAPLLPPPLVGLFPTSMAPPARGAFIPRGYQPRGGITGSRGNFGSGSFPSHSTHSNEMYRGGYRGGYRGTRGGNTGHAGGTFPRKERTNGYTNGYHNGQKVAEPSNGAGEMSDFINSIGPQGTVLSCTGFPTDVTLEDVMELFKAYEADPTSVRIRRDEEGVITGECMLSCSNPEKTQMAAKEIDGQSLRGSKISLSVANP